MKTWRIIFGLLVVLLGVLLLGQQYSWWTVQYARLWPLFILVPGLVLLVISSTTGRLGTIIPGVLLTTYGLVFFVQIWVHWRHAEAYSALYPFGVAVAFVTAALARPEQRRRWLRLAAVMTIAAIIVLLSTTSYASAIVPVLIIFLGCWVLLGRRRPAPLTYGPVEKKPGLD